MKDLREIFQKNCLNLVKTASITSDGDNRPFKGNNCFVWGFYHDGELRDILEHGEKSIHGRHGYSINNYIRLTDDSYSELSRLILIGPNSNTLTQSVEFLKRENGAISIIAQGWGSSFVNLWDGSESEIVEFLRENRDEQ